MIVLIWFGGANDSGTGILDLVDEYSQWQTRVQYSWYRSMCQRGRKRSLRWSRRSEVLGLQHPVRETVDVLVHMPWWTTSTDNISACGNISFMFLFFAFSDTNDSNRRHCALRFFCEALRIVTIELSTTSCSSIRSDLRLTGQYSMSGVDTGQASLPAVT